MPPRGARGAAGRALGAALAALVALVALAALASAPGCGKKAPLRLPDQVRPEEAAALRASVSEGAVTLRLRTPARRLFPEREEPWVLARILRRVGTDPEFGEAGAILDTAGLPFDAELTWVDAGRAAGVPLVYRVEFRDARRRRRALTPALAVSWPAAPGAPSALAASGSPGAVALAWEAPGGAPAGVRYRVLRREVPGGPAEPLPGAEVAAPAFLDSRVAAGREYCYTVRAFLEGTGTQVEGPDSEERCARALGAPAPPAPSGAAARAVGRAYQVSWGAVAAPGLAGYHVYRAVGEGSLERLTERPLAGTVFVDDPGELPPGTGLRWTVTAVGGGAGGGESAMSAPATAVAGGP